MNEPVRILLVAENPADARNLRAALAEPGDVCFQVEWVARLSAALTRVAEDAVDAILLDLFLADSQGLETFSKMRAQAPSTPIIVLTDLEDDPLVLETISRGAQDCLGKRQVNSTLVTRCVRRAIERERARGDKAGSGSKARRVLAFLGVKGGVGATTVALNVAAVQARTGARVIAIELMPGWGSFSSHLRQTPPLNLRNLLYAADGRLPELKLMAHLVRLPFGTQVLFGPQHFEEFGEIRAEHAQALIRSAAQVAECVVIDLPPLPSPASEAAIRECHAVTLVVDREPGSVLAAKTIAALLRSWGNVENALGAVIVNRTPLVTSPSSAEIRSQLGCRILGTVPHDAEICAEALRLGAPVAICHPENVVAESLAALAGRFGDEAGESIAL